MAGMFEGYPGLHGTIPVIRIQVPGAGAEGEGGIDKQGRGR